jgi:hypothetical protein
MGPWLFLLLILLQWVAGRVFIHVVYTARIERMMTVQEEAIAHKLKAEIGVTAHVKILDKEDLQIIQGMGYGAPFLFSEESNGKTQYYTVDAKSPHGLRHEYKIASPQEEKERSLPKALTERLFSDYCFEEHGLLTSIPFFTDNTKTASVLFYRGLLDLAHLSIPSPPPQLI